MAADPLDEHVRFYKKNTPAFGEREFWECKICRSNGRDEPALGQTARQMAEAHFEKAALHFRAVAFIPPPRGEDDLFKWMKEELAMYGRLAPTDAAVVGSQLATDYFRSELRDRDDTIERLTQKVNELSKPPEAHVRESVQAKG